MSLKFGSAPNAETAIARYRRHARAYDASARRTMPLRRRVISLLELRPGETVLDVGCGTGLSIPILRQAVGPGGRVVGVDVSPEMLAVARERGRREGWGNVALIEGSMDHAPLPRLDAVLFNYTHDVLRSARALGNIFSAARPGARVAVAGMKRLPWWLAPLNVYVLLKARPYLTTFEGLGRPWSLLERHVPRLRIETVHLGTGFIAHGVYVGDGPRP